MWLFVTSINALVTLDLRSHKRKSVTQSPGNGRTAGPPTNKDNVTPQGRLAISGDIFYGHKLGEVGTGIYQAEARVAAKRPTVARTAPKQGIIRPQMRLRDAALKEKKLSPLTPTTLGHNLKAKMPDSRGQQRLSATRASSKGNQKAGHKLCGQTEAEGLSLTPTQHVALFLLQCLLILNKC